LEFVPKIFQRGVFPLAIEYMEKEMVDQTAEILGMSWPCKEGKYHLMLILAETSEEALLTECEKLMDLCEKVGVLEPIIAERREEQAKILKIRSEIYSALKNELIDILDTTVPPSKMVDLIESVNKLAKKYETYIPAFGHAGDGNLHLHIMRKEGWDRDDYDRLRDEIYKKTIQLGGTITGEHGIGYVRRECFKKFVDRKALELMKEIKRIFDPNNILNPDKIFI